MFVYIYMKSLLCKRFFSRVPGAVSTTPGPDAKGEKEDGTRCN